ncbi:MAG TPA: hypothetical protein VEQ60_28375, partial [Longimicrobium sp.]|nr:hypothetical protein [Longimicrobium sp.]
MAQDEYAFDLEAARAAADRWEQNHAQHERFDEAVRTDTLFTLDTPRRRALRTRRLLGRLQESAPEAAAEAVTEALSTAAVVIGPAENLGD